MSTGLHRDLELSEIHALQAFEYADATARLAASLNPDDVGKVARQLDNDSFWILTDDDPLTWVPIASTVAAGLKSGLVVAGSFGGNPKVAAVGFSQAFGSDNYSITLSVETTNNFYYPYVITNKTASGFTINLLTNNINNLVKVDWQAMPVGE